MSEKKYWLLTLWHREREAYYQVCTTSDPGDYMAKWSREVILINVLELTREQFGKI
jgi:hypothetical protein